MVNLPWVCVGTNTSLGNAFRLNDNNKKKLGLSLSSQSLA
jgi:hypothetical protein